MSTPIPATLADVFADTPAPVKRKPVPESDPIKDALAAMSTSQINDILDRAEKAQTLTKALETEQAARQQTTVALTEASAQVQRLQTEVRDLTAALQSAPTQVVHVEPAKPGIVPGTVVPVLDSWYVPTPGTALLEAFHAKAFGAHVVACVGEAGAGKSAAIEAVCAKLGLSLAAFNCKTADPFSWVESHEITSGQTVWNLGPIAQVAKSGQGVVIFMDEIDTAPPEFQSLMLSALEREASRRRLITVGNGPIACDKVQWVLAMNSTGLDPASRHPGRLIPALHSRCAGGWIKFQAPDLALMTSILKRRFPRAAAQAERVAKGISALRGLKAGTLDVDVSLRTGVAVMDAFTLTGDETQAWGMGLLDGIDAHTQRRTAESALSTIYTGFKAIK